MKVGIFFGGPSREREISFAGGRTVFDNLDKTRFEALPFFVDAHRRLILLDWQYLYKGTIRDFYPPANHLPSTESRFQLYIDSLGNKSREELDLIASELGILVPWEDLKEHIDFAFLALHGVFGEDGQIQSLLDHMEIPYTGSGVFAGAVGMDKVLQKKWMRAAGFNCPESLVYQRGDNVDFDLAKEKLGLPLVVRPANQGSSIGVGILREAAENAYQLLIDRAFFRQKMSASVWQELSTPEKEQYVRDITDIRYGLGFPLYANLELIYLPSELISFLDSNLLDTESEPVLMQAVDSERQVIAEQFIHGREFSCIVIRLPDGTSCALPPTEIIKGDEVFDYRSKYLPGLSRKETPIRLDTAGIEAIRTECQRLFEFMEFKSYARIDGFLADDGLIYLNDPNTTSGMMPSSFFFHQAAEIGLNPSRFLSYLIYISLIERKKESLRIRPDLDRLIEKIESGITLSDNVAKKKIRVAVIMGGYSFERHISMESGRNIYEKLAASAEYEPIPVFLSGTSEAHELYVLPINLLLKDNADDIASKIRSFKQHEIIQKIRTQCTELTLRFADPQVVFEPIALTYEDLATMADVVFIALHGRPGEDGTLQKALEAVGLPYNGSGVVSSSTTIDKYKTLQTLKAYGFKVAKQFLLEKQAFVANSEALLKALEEEFKYPFVAKPVDDGCSSAVKVIRNREQFIVYLNAIFRETEAMDTRWSKSLNLASNEEFPRKTVVLIEELVTSAGADHFLEITGGMYTRKLNGGKPEYVVFEASEALSGGEVLSLEEKFLAGEGQNITPARYHSDPEISKQISQKVKMELGRAAEILGVEGYCRIDAFVRVFSAEEVEVLIIEVNSLPGMTPATCIFHQAALEGLQPHHFIDRILQYGMGRNVQSTSKEILS
jgi:UDP-N-acetylmuramate--alanine ligase